MPWTPRTCTLHDGRKVASDSEDWRLETLARWVLTLKPLAVRRAWLAGFREKSPHAADELERWVVALHSATKRGRK